MAEAKIANIAKGAERGFVPPKVKKNLTPPTLKLETDVTRYVQVTNKMYLGREIVEKDPTKQKRGPATILDVVDLETGEVGQIVAPTILQSTLRENYPNDSYVDKRFAITKRGKVPGKDYSKVEVLELE